MNNFLRRLQTSIIQRIKVLSFLRRETGFSLKEIILQGALGGLANAVILVIMTMALQDIYEETADFRIFLMYILAMVILFMAQRRLYFRWVHLLEAGVDRTRNHLAGAILNSRLDFIEGMDLGEVYNRLTQELNNIAQFGAFLITGIQSVFFLLFIVIFLVSYFLPSVIIIGIMTLAGTVIYLGIIRRISERYQHVNAKEVEYFDLVHDILKGTKEIKYHAGRREHIENDAGEVSTNLRNKRIEIGRLYNFGTIFGATFFYVLFGVIVFIVPLFYSLPAGMTIILVAVTIYLTSPINDLVVRIPIFQKVGISIGFIESLENQLLKNEEKIIVPAPQAARTLQDFSRIELDKISFRYKNHNNGDYFSVGPLSLTVRRGEILFLTGGNGCGKTTLLKLIASLYTPDEGKIQVDATQLNATHLYEYRDLFSAVFSDFHLFDRLYGINLADQKSLPDYLEIMKLTDKVSIKNGTFSTLELSTGQRKRLALIVAILEDKPVYLLDEWAAEQDHELRDYFYKHMLGDLRRKGKTLVVVSHDERYYNYADRVIQMDYGKIREEIATNHQQTQEKQ